MAIPLKRVLRSPEAVAEEISATQYGVTVRFVGRKDGKVVFDGSFVPPAAFAREHYPLETAHIVVDPQGGVWTYPSESRRSWEHRNGPAGELCLWFEGDPRELRWEWEDGFDGYVAIVHRHLVYEEFFRREGHWPVEAAEHGRGDRPIAYLETKWKQQLWKR